MSQRAVRILLVVLAGIIITLEVSGCKGKQEPGAIKEKMLAYFEEKYGEEFLPLSFESSGFAYSHNTLWAYPKKGPNPTDLKSGGHVWRTVRTR
ncbi:MULTISPECIES: hypothetical protein [unclassified Paenibacillus]|uniref:hypothetical protein n=1 Tax=unclassified Paenibacillus TaxID=185978 RepID=UPI0030F666D6